MDANEPPCPSPYPPSSLLKDISNFKTPKRPPSHFTSASPQFFTASKLPSFTSSSPQFFTASKLTPRSSFRRRPSLSKPRTATARRLKAFEAQQSQSSRKAQLRKEQCLKSLSKSLTTWLNVLFCSPTSCGCNFTFLDGHELGAFSGLGKRDADPRGHVGVEATWRCPKRQKDLTWRGGTDVEGLSTSKCYGLLRNSLKDVCSLDDLKVRMRVYLSLAHCREIFDVMAHVAKNIDERRLKMKTHCPIVTDVGMKEKAMRILMCYNPIWLRIGLYIIFGGDSLLPNGDVNSDQEIAFLKMVIDKQFFSHAGLAKSYAYNKMVEGLYRPGYYEVLGSVILKRFLLLILVLDRAKSQSSLPLKYGIDGVDGGSPPLFMVQSSMKSNRDVINDFLSTEVMHGEGNLLAHLAIVGYKVSYQQCPLVDYNFRMTDLFVDLQDGVRLCRVIQLLQNDASILMKLLVPSNTHKKSMANCGVALRYLNDAGVALHDEDGMKITEDDIANGDKELIISLLWNIFVQLQLPLLLNKEILMEEIARIRGTKEDSSIGPNSSHLELLLNWIQAVSKKYDHDIDSFSSLLDGKAIWCLLDYYFRKELSCSHSLKDVNECRVEESIMSVTDYTDAVHNFILSQKLTTLLGDLPEVLETSEILEHSGAISDRSVIVLLVFLASQLIMKKTMDQLNFHKLLGCNCQSSESRHSSTEGFPESWKVVTEQQETYEHGSGDAAKKFNAIKAWWQDMAERNSKFVAKPDSSAFEHNKVSNMNIDIEKENAAKIIQSHFRRSIDQRNFWKMKNAVSFLQTLIRAWLLVKLKLVNHKFCTVPVQGFTYERRNQSEKVERYVKFIDERHNFVELRRSVLAIQQAARIWIARRHRNRKISSFKDLLNAAVVIQKYTRGWMTRSWYKVNHMEKASLTCQVNICNIPEIEAATKIQLAWKKFYLSRCLNQKDAAIKIQTHFRRWLLSRRFLCQRQAVIKIQTHFRCLRCQRDFQQLRIATRSAIIIQSHVRGWIARRRAWRSMYLIGVIQKYTRGWMARSRYKVAQMGKASFTCQVNSFDIPETEAATKIQLAWKNFSHARCLNQHFAAIKIQSLFRGWLLSRRLLYQKQAIIKIQSHFRCLRCQRDFHQLRIATRSAIDIQSHVRGWIARRKTWRHRYLIGVVQRCCRGWLIRRNFLFQRKAVIMIQSVIRCLNSLRLFNCQKHAAIEIQRFARGQIARNRLLGASHFPETKNCNSRISVGCIQNFELNIVVSSVLKLQRWWRRVLLLKLRTRSVITIQSHVRGWITRQRASRDRQRVIVIQSYWKGYLARKGSRGQLLDLCLRVQKSAKNVDDSQRIINRLKMALSDLPKMKSITEILRTVATLNMATEISQKCCEELVAAGAIHNLLKLICSVTRSIPDQEVLKHALSTLRNLARYPHLIEVLISSHGSVEIIFWEMLRNKEESYFIASEILKKICSNQKGIEAVHKLPSLLKRLHILVEELTKKATNEKKKPRGTALRENTERRLREAIELLKLITYC